MGVAEAVGARSERGRSSRTKQDVHQTRDAVVAAWSVTRPVPHVLSRVWHDGFMFSKGPWTGLGDRTQGGRRGMWLG